jgi:TPP-dependent pyruvate/acetoin dehydrogenase alpha subunit
VDTQDLSRILSLIISVLTDPYDQFIERLRAEGRITEGEVQQLRRALKEQIPKVSDLIKPHPNLSPDA